MSDDKLVEPQLFDAFPKPMRKAHADAIRAHRLRNEIIATKVANRLVNRLGPGVAFDLTEEEGASLQQVDRRLPRRRAAARPRQAVGGDRAGRRCPKRCASSCSRSPRRAFASHLSDILRAAGGETQRQQALCKLLEPGVRKISAAATKLIRSEVRNEAAARRDRLIALGASEDIVRGLVRLYELDGVFGIAALAARKQDRRAAADPRLHPARRGARPRLGAAAGRALRARRPVGAAADRRPGARFRAAADRLPRRACRGERPGRRASSDWIDAAAAAHRPVPQARSRAPAPKGHVSAPMLAQIASQARILLAR